MSKVALQTVTGGVNVTWEDNPYMVRVRRLHCHKDGRVTGEISILVEQDGKPSFVYPTTQVNFGADRTRSGLAKQLTEDSPNYPWSEMVKQVFHKVLDFAREGEPSQELWAGLDDENIVPPSYMLYPLIVENLPNVIFGDPGTLKSTMALELCTLVLLQQTDNNLRLHPNTHNEVKSLYLDWETDKATVTWQLYRIQRGMGLPPVVINYRRCFSPLSQDVEAIAERISETNSSLIIIDSLGLACGGDLNKTEGALEFFKALRQLNVTSLILAHTSKDKDSTTKSVFGTVFFEAQARNIWEVRKVQDTDEDELSIALFHTKPPPFSKKHSPLGYLVQFDDKDNTTIINYHDPKDIDEFVQRMGYNQKILSFLKSGAYRPIEISKELNIKPDTVRQSLRRLLKAGEVIKLEDGKDAKYGLLLQRDKCHVTP